MAITKIELLNKNYEQLVQSEEDLSKQLRAADELSAKRGATIQELQANLHDSNRGIKQSTKETIARQVQKIKELEARLHNADSMMLEARKPLSTFDNDPAI